MVGKNSYFNNCAPRRKFHAVCNKAIYDGIGSTWYSSSNDMYD
ncbi:MAG: hypothetical protein ACYCR7_00845 [Thermoplasmataceae archaeon]